MSFLSDWIIHFVPHTYKIKPLTVTLTAAVDNHMVFPFGHSNQMIDFKNRNRECFYHLLVHCVWLLPRLIFTGDTAQLQVRFCKHIFQGRLLALQMETRLHLLAAQSLWETLMPALSGCLAASILALHQNKIFRYKITSKNKDCVSVRIIKVMFNS